MSERRKLRSAFAEATRLPPPHERPRAGRDALTLLVDNQPDVLAHVYNFLPAKSLGRMQRVNKTQRAFLRQPEMEDVWRARCAELKVLNENTLPSAPAWHRYNASRIATVELVQCLDEGKTKYKIKTSANGGVEPAESVADLPPPLANFWAAVVHLLRSGASVDVRDRQMQTSLHWAATCGDEPMARALVAAGVDPRATARPSRVRGAMTSGSRPIDVCAPASEVEHYLRQNFYMTSMAWNGW